MTRDYQNRYSLPFRSHPITRKKPVRFYGPDLYLTLSFVTIPIAPGFPGKMHRDFQVVDQLVDKTYRLDKNSM